MVNGFRFHDDHRSHKFGKRIRIGGDGTSGEECSADDCKYKEKGTSAIRFPKPWELGAVGADVVLASDSSVNSAKHDCHAARG